MTRIPIQLSESEQAVVASERFSHPDLRVRCKMLALWSVHTGLTRLQSAKVAGVGRATVQRYRRLAMSGPDRGYGFPDWGDGDCTCQGR